MPRSAKDVVKHAKDVVSIPRTLPSMPKHALGTHTLFFVVVSTCLIFYFDL